MCLFVYFLLLFLMSINVCYIFSVAYSFSYLWSRYFEFCFKLINYYFVYFNIHCFSFNSLYLWPWLMIDWKKIDTRYQNLRHTLCVVISYGTLECKTNKQTKNIGILHICSLAVLCGETDHPFVSSPKLSTHRTASSFCHPLPQIPALVDIARNVVQ